ncbi:Mitochondrial glycoprotein [Dillenia turbinata]|uniref:Mitochondrial glycoprotein n=1 Tax=Dillenia turbinata TaxID=194707 RepID=A0AAN8YWT0_9MAGN
MACFLQASKRSLLPSTTKTLIHLFHYQHQNRHFLQSYSKHTSDFILQTRNHTSVAYKSPCESNILRIIDNEIEYQSEYAHPTQYNSFAIDRRKGQQFITLSSKFGENEEIKIEATMFNGSEIIPQVGDDDSREDLRLHIGLIINISEEEDGKLKDMEFLCSAWQDALEIQKVYTVKWDGLVAAPYMGPNFRVAEYVAWIFRGRGVNSEFCMFLHDYMMSKDRIEFIHWLGKIKNFVERAEAQWGQLPAIEFSKVVGLDLDFTSQLGNWCLLNSAVEVIASLVSGNFVATWRGSKIPSSVFLNCGLHKLASEFKAKFYALKPLPDRGLKTVLEDGFKCCFGQQTQPNLPRSGEYIIKVTPYTLHERQQVYLPFEIDRSGFAPSSSSSSSTVFTLTFMWSSGLFNGASGHSVSSSAESMHEDLDNLVSVCASAIGE